MTVRIGFEDETISQIDHISDKRHRQFEELLPWFANGTLGASERVEVERHLSECAACRSEAASEARLRDAVAKLPIASNVTRNWPHERFPNALHRPVLRKARAASSRKTAIARAFARLGKAGWIIGAQAAALVLVVSANMSGTRLMSPDTSGQYGTLSSAPVTTEGNLIVMFDPSATISDMRAALEAADVRIIGGPTATGGYILHVADQQRGAALTTLRAAGAVTLAEPIEGSTPR